jgi:predicted amidohydrolase
MGVKIALCQMASAGDVGSNLDCIRRSMTHTDADVYVFPELFLTGRDADLMSLREDVEFAVDRMSIWCSEVDAALIFGAPAYVDGTIRNSVYFVTQGETVRYDGPPLTAEEAAPGGDPVAGRFKGATFGLGLGSGPDPAGLIRLCADGGAWIVICPASVDGAGMGHCDRMLSEHSRDNLVYTVFVNSPVRPGEGAGGRSRLIGPDGDTLFEAGEDEGISCVYLDEAVVDNIRSARRPRSGPLGSTRWQP